MSGHKGHYGIAVKELLLFKKSYQKYADVRLS
jgi:hypothetical protein